MSDQFQAQYGTHNVQQGQPFHYAQPMTLGQPQPVRSTESHGTVPRQPMPYPQPPGMVPHQPMPYSQPLGTVPHQPIPYSQPPGATFHQPMPYPQHGMAYPQVATHPYQPYPQLPTAHVSPVALPQYYQVYPAAGAPVASPTPSHQSLTSSPVIRASTSSAPQQYSPSASPIVRATTPSAPQQYPPSASPISSPAASPQPALRAPQVYPSSPQTTATSSPRLTSISQINLASPVSSVPPSPQIYQAQPVYSASSAASMDQLLSSSPLLGPVPIYEPSNSPAALAAAAPEKSSSAFHTEPPAYTPPAAASTSSGFLSLDSSSTAATEGNGLPITNLSDDDEMKEFLPRVQPKLPQAPADWRPATGTTDKVLRLDPLPFGWTPENPEGDVYIGGGAPRNGYQNVVWRNAMPSLGCDGCHRLRAFDHPIRYTCADCPPGTFDLCVECFTTKDVAALHNPNHTLYKMDITFPDWNNPCWNAGVQGMGEAVSQVGSRTLHWDPDDYKKGDQWAKLYAKGLTNPPKRNYEIVEWNGMAMSMDGVIAMLLAIHRHVVEINIRSNPKFSGFNLVQAMHAIVKKIPYAFPKLKVIRAIGCGFFDWRTKELAKILSVETTLFRVLEYDRQQLLKKHNQPTTDTEPYVVLTAKQRSSSGGGFLGGMFKKKQSKEKYQDWETDSEGNVVIRGKVKVQFTICDGILTTPCGFQGLQAGIWSGREPRLCYHLARDVMLELVEYLGCPDRLADPIRERTRVLNKRKRERYNKFCEMIGMDKLNPAQQEAANAILNRMLDRTVASY
ncbi:hypothetical protein BGW42_000155 [Actinomortierella wolfii]|nr:hypothetical protein BGW42_000155 [Actinomortierella wolfii]